MNNKIIQGDCLEVIKSLSSCSVDLIVSDPPYGDNVSYGYMNKTIKNNENPLVGCLSLVECYRVLKNNKTLYLFTNWKHLPFLNEFVLRYTKFKIKHLIVWRKKNFGMGYAFRHQFELILVLEKGKPKYNSKSFSDVQDGSYIVHNKETHPHQKPLDLLTRIIEHSSQSKDLVLDPFCGSGSTCVAAEISGRKWLGIEQDARYAEMARKRVSDNTGGNNALR